MSQQSKGYFSSEDKNSSKNQRKTFVLPNNEAIIYLPGLGNNNIDQSMEGVAYRLKKALDINSSEARLKFHIEVKKVKYGRNDTLEANVATIYKDPGSAPPPGAETSADNPSKSSGSPVYTLYELAYADVLTERYQRSTILYKAFMLFYTIVLEFPSFLMAFFKNRPGLDQKAKLQYLYMVFIFFVLSVYGLLVLTAFLAALKGKLHFNNIPPVSDVFGRYFEWIEWPAVLSPLKIVWAYIAAFFMFIGDLIETYKKYIIASAAAFLLFMPDMKNFITNMATDYLCLIHYFNTGERRLNIIGKLEELMEYITESPDQYNKINIMGYSFGTIVAIDALHPMGDRPSHRLKTRVNKLVTIGCPVDFIRVYWPHYYRNRNSAGSKLEKWYNVYSTPDILSSNFRNDSKKDEAEDILKIGQTKPNNISYDLIGMDDAGFWNQVLLMGLRAHRMYWDDEVYSASCFSSLVQEMCYIEMEETVYSV